MIGKRVLAPTDEVMTTFETTQTAGPDGILHFDVPVAEANRPYRVVIAIEPSVVGAKDVERDERGWPKGFFDLAGSWKGEFPQEYEGDYEKRFEL